MVGTNTLNSGGTKYQATSIKVKEDYNARDIINDLGLVIVGEDIKFDDKVQPIELGRDYTPGGATVVLSGWGTTSVTILYEMHIIFYLYTYNILFYFY